VRGMLSHKDARMRMCVMKVGQRGRWTYQDWARWRFLWRFFPWYAREMRYRGDFCIGHSCMHWFWEDAGKKERGYCSAAVSRTQHMMWAAEWEQHDRRAPETGSLRRGEQPERRERAARGRWPLSSVFEVVISVAFMSAILFAVVVSLM
jgi:hypothetical protein